VIDWGFMDQAGCNRIYENLRKSKLWETGSECPGVATIPRYPLKEKAPQIRFSRMHGYHDEYIWTWIAAFSAKIAYKMNDVEEGDRIASILARLVKRDSTILEIYQQNSSMRPVGTSIYRDEEDFSWSAGKYVEMVHERNFQVSSSITEI